MKFNIIPTESIEKTKATLRMKYGRDYLREDLRERLSNRPVKFIFAVQLEKDPAMTPIEDNLQEWTETASPSIPVAELTLDPIENEGEADYERNCSSLRFTPGHYIPEHRPLSNMGRGRLFGYEASQMGRPSNSEEPSSLADIAAPPSR